jgi:hypothetical protein
VFASAPDFMAKMPAEPGSRGLTTGHLVSLAGAAAAIGSLWAPWYKLDIASILPAINAKADQLLSPAAAQAVHNAAAVLPPSATVDAWTIFHRNDIVIAVLSGLVALLVLAAAGTFGDGVALHPRAAARGCVSLGLICSGLVAIQLATQQKTPPGVPSSAISVQWGGYLCLAAAVTMLVGGLMAQSGARRAADDWAPPAADRWSPPAETWTPPVDGGFSSPVVNAHDDAARRTTSIAPPGATQSDAA